MNPKPGKPSSVVDTRVIWCGDCLEQLRRLPDACVDLCYIDPPFNSNRNWYPIQVKQKDKAGSPDIRDFAGVLSRDKRSKGFFVSFAYSEDALHEVDAIFRATGRVIVPLTVHDILEEHLAQKLA